MYFDKSITSCTNYSESRSASQQCTYTGTSAPYLRLVFDFILSNIQIEKIVTRCAAFGISFILG